MAILKHISVKNRFYSSAVEYLTCQFDEYTNKPVLGEKGRIQERENYLIAGVNCDVDSFGAECIEVNRLYGKNNCVKDVKAHHYIISFEPNDLITMEQALEFGKQWLDAFAPGHQAVVAVHPDGHNGSQNMHVHMVINSVRKYAGKQSRWHDKPCERKQGCKHKSDGKMMFHAKKWVMEKCIRLGFGQVDLLAKKHTDNYWVEKRLMNQNAKDGVGVTSNRELIRDTIDKLLPFMDSFEQLVECLQFMYGWKIRVTNKSVTFSTADMKQGIRGNKLGEGYGKAELVERIAKIVAERNAEKEARRIAEEEAGVLWDDVLKGLFGTTHKWKWEYMDYLEDIKYQDTADVTLEMAKGEIMSYEEFAELKETEKEIPEQESEVVEISIDTMDDVQAAVILEEVETEIPEIKETVSKEADAVSEVIDFTKISIKERAVLLPVPTDDYETEYDAYCQRMGYTAEKMKSIRYKMAVYDEFLEEYQYRKKYYGVRDSSKRVTASEKKRGAR